MQIFLVINDNQSTRIFQALAPTTSTRSEIF